MDFYSAFEVKTTAEQLEKSPFLFLNNHPKQFNVRTETYLRDMVASSEELTSLFYSIENQDIIQRQIVLEVFKARNVRIGYQSPQRLMTLMKYVFEDAMPRVITKYTNLTDMIRHINKVVVDEAVNRNGAILSNLDHTLFYLDDISKNPTPIDLPVNVSKRGTRTLPAFSGRR
jgi:hypothetical protein